MFRVLPKSSIFILKQSPLKKAPYLGKLSVTYDVENVGLSHFSSDENKGSQLIAEIRCSVIKPLITDSMASISLVI